MRKPFLSLILLALCLTLAAAGKGGPEMADKNLVYQVNWSSSNISGSIVLNGFEIGQIDGDEATGFPASLWLTGKNTLEVKAGKKDKQSPAQLSVNVSALELGDVTATDEKGNIASITITDKDLAKGIVEHSAEFGSTFDFSAHLLGPTAEAKDVTAYAAKVYALFAKKDAKGLAREFTVKVEDSSAAFYQKIAPEQFVEMLENDLLQDKIVKVDPKNIKAIKANPAGTLWHVYDGTEELIRTSSADGSTSSLPIYIGQVNGQLKIIR